METLPVAVIVERTRLVNRWVDERWEMVGVVPMLAEGADPGPQQIYADEVRRQYRVGGLSIELHRDDAEGYFLNLSAPAPKVFVMWRLEDDFARPALVTASYSEAARMLDGGEQVDGVAMSREIADWVGDFMNRHYKPEPRRKIRRNDPFAGPRGGGRQ